MKTDSLLSMPCSVYLSHSRVWHCIACVAGGFDVCVTCARQYGEVSAEEKAALHGLAHACLDPAKVSTAAASTLPSGTFEKRRLEQRTNGDWGEIEPPVPTQLLGLPASHQHLTAATPQHGGDVSFFSVAERQVGVPGSVSIHVWDAKAVTATTAASAAAPAVQGGVPVSTPTPGAAAAFLGPAATAVPGSMG